MIIKCLVIDDEPLALSKMSGYIEKTPFLQLAGSCRSGYEAIDFISKSKVDLIFVDINMPDINGLDFVKTLHDKPAIIFTTAFSEYAIEGFKLDALDYLLKPIGYSEFLKSANKARNHFDRLGSDTGKEPSQDKHIFIKADSKISKVALTDIIYIEGMREYVRIHLASGKSLMPLMSMYVLEKYLPPEIFMRVHRSYIVNLEKINTVENNRIVFDGKVYIPVSDQYRELFQNYLSSHTPG